MTTFGSVVNAISARSLGTAPPVVGEGCTELCWTDRHAGTVTWVSESGKSFRYRLDKAVRVDHNGMSECQDYRYEPGNGEERTARLTKRGWASNGTRLVTGYRETYHDFSF